MNDELRATVADPADLVLYDEARRCLEGGAFRAAYIISWIAAAEGILGKLRTMATMHGALGTFVGNFEAQQKAGTAKDAELIHEAAKVGLITTTERIALDAIRDLRNQYGHPTEASPDRATAEHALHVAVTSVLAKPASIMHGAAKELAQRIASDRHLVPSDDSAIDGFIAARAPYVHEGARPLFLRELIAGADGQLADPNGQLLADRAIRMAALSAIRWQHALTGPGWNVDQLQRSHPAATAAALSQPDVWPLLDDETHDQLLSHCLDPNTGAAFTSTPARLLSCADELRARSLLTETQQNRVRAAIAATDPRRLIASGMRFEHAARAISDLLRSPSFRTAGDGVDLLRSTDASELSALAPELQYELGLSLAYAANRNTFSAINELESMVHFPDRWPIEFQRGVVTGALTGLYAPLRHAGATKAAALLALEDDTGTLGRAALDALTDEKRRMTGAPDAIAELRSVLDDGPPSPAVDSLRSFLDALQADTPEPLAEA